ncbi:hypothetical protein [Flavobacterium beibuense]|uniref:Uncharacterized protein n=1 Tax=Flavobacterium beibuense TaxID=657326 RepID=A0A444WI46_9FLAO|nr:hypothetical protein [Flavobacterium beibuense]RYJ45422.1 hypothetical protein NU09_0014 [Flavobacterium beibuense]
MNKPFIEEDFISALNAVLRQFYPKFKLRISRVSSSEEKKLGYDGEVHYLKPIFIQFKRSAFFDTTYTGKYKKARKALTIPYTSFYSFKLHKNSSAKTVQDIHIQHNMLFNLSQSEEAFYLAPLFHTKSELDDFNFSIHHSMPGRFNYDIYDGTYHSKSYIDDLIFSNTIGVKPHKIINDKDNHCYTYDDTLKVAFHSQPESLENNGFNIMSFFNNINADDNKKYSAIKTFRTVEKICLESKLNFWTDIDFLSEFHFSEKINRKNLESEDYKKLGILIEYYLKDHFNIDQYVLLG